MPHTLNSHVSNGTIPYSNKAIHVLLMHPFSTLNMLVLGHYMLGQLICLLLIYLHFRSKPLMNLEIFATVHSLINLIDSRQAHLPMQYALNIKLIRQK